MFTDGVFEREVGLDLGDGFRRFLVRSRSELEECVRKWNGVCNIYCSIQDLSEMSDYIISGKVRLRRMFFDFDSEDISAARAEAEKVYGYFDTRKFMVFSGNRGYHVHIFFKPVVLNSFNAMRLYVLDLVKKFDLKTLDVQSSYKPRQLARLPGTVNVKSGRYATVVESDFDGEDASMDFSVYDRVEEKPRPTVSSTVFQRNEKVAEVLRRRGEYFSAAIAQFRPEVARLVREATVRNLEHEERLIILFEAIACGWEDYEIVPLFSFQSDFSVERTLYMIRHARKRGYKPYSRKKIMEVFVNEPDRNP
jgi:hypothetical protein